MARPKKDTVDYFPHDSNHKKTMYIIEQRYGNDGYAFWFKLLELLAESDRHYIDFNDGSAWEFLQAKTSLSGDYCTDILNLLAKLGAIDSELWAEKVVWCQKFVDRITDVYSNRRVETPARPSFYIQKPLNVEVSTDDNLEKHSVGVVSTPNNPQTKLKETKLKETKLKKSITSIFDHWNSKGIITHKKLTGNIEHTINGRLSIYSIGELTQAIDNYALILYDEDCELMQYRWTLKEFFTGERIDKFLNLEVSKENYRRKELGTHRQNAREIPGTHKTPGEFRAGRCASH